MNNADFWVALYEAADDLEDAYLGLSETKRQYDAEVALCGDAWPGAQLQLAACEVAVARAVERYNQLQDIA